MDRLEINCFGSLRVQCDGKPVVGFGTDKVKALLVYLAVESNREHPREALAGLLWSDQSNDNAMHSLRQALSSLKKTLGEERNKSPFLIIERDSVQINPMCDVSLDTDHFDQCLKQAYRYYQHRNGAGRLNLRALQKAALLYRGPFLDQFYLPGNPLFDEWALFERENYSRQAVQALGLIADYHERRGEYTLALRAAERLVELIPWEENAHHTIMRLLAIDGQYSAAQAQYMTCRRELQNELGLKPSADLEQLFAEIRESASTRQLLPQRFPKQTNNLPEPDSVFVGREDELDQLAELLANPQSRIITLAGMGGSGKTRLAIQAAADQIGLFGQVIFVSLSGIPDFSALIAATAAEAGFHFFGERSPVEQLIGYLRAKDILLVLDNIEHLLTEDGSLIQFMLELLRECPKLKFLITSRNILNLRQEHVVDVHGLPFPGPDQKQPRGKTDAVDLFELTARHLLPIFSAQKEWQEVVDICRELNGIPLAVELAASAVRVQTCKEILEEIRADIDSLSTRMIDIPERHRSIRVVIDHSWRLLSSEEQQALKRLSVFSGIIHCHAASAVCGATQEILENLARQSLLYRTGPRLYQMHPLVRRYAGEKLTENDEEGCALWEIYANYYADFLGKRSSLLKGGDQQEALIELDRELVNWRTAWEWMVINDRKDNLMLAGEAVFQYFNIRASFTEGINLFQKAVDRLDANTDVASRALLGRLLTYLGGLAYRGRENQIAWLALDQARKYFDDTSDPSGLAFCLIFYSAMLSRRKEHQQATAAVEESLDIYRREGDAWGESYALYLMGLYLNRKGAIKDARITLETSLTAARVSGDMHRQIGPLNILGDEACQLGDYSRAIDYFEECLRLSRGIQDRYNEALVILNLGTVYHLRKEYAKARNLYAESLDICGELGDEVGQAIALSNLGELLIDCGEYVEAMPYFEKGLILSRAQQDEWAEMSLLNNLANASLEAGDLTTAKRYINDAILLVQALDAPPLAGITLLHLSRYLLVQGDQRRAKEVLLTLTQIDGLEEDIKRRAIEILESLNSGESTETATLEEVLSRFGPGGELYSFGSNEANNCQ